MKNKELEALKRVKSRLDTEDLYLFENDLKIIEKSLKALEIIKNNFIWLEDDEDIFVGIPYDCEIKLTKDEFDTEEEYDLLKEALK